VLCPHCKTEQPEPPPKFCDKCGLVTGLKRPTPASASAKKKQEELEVHCSECGIIATSRRCRGCGSKIRWPDDVLPPDERPVRATGPAIELEAPVLELPPDGGGGDDDSGSGDWN
jgi:hypothetical protein